MIRGVTFRVGLRWAMGLVVAAYLAGLVLEGGASTPIVGIWFSLLTDWVPVAVCWLAVWRVGFGHREVLLAAAALTVYGVGDTYYTPFTSSWPPPFPSLGDVAYLLFYPLMLAALVVAVRHNARRFAWSVWLDCAVGSLGAAAVLAVVLRPVMDSATAGPHSWATIVSVAYPMSDMVLVAAVVGMVAVRGVRAGDHLVLLIMGLLVFAAADVVYALQELTDAYAVGSPLDGAWTIGVVLIAVYVDFAADPDGSTARETHPETRVMSLLLSAMATAAGLGVLLVSSRMPLSALAVTLAGVTLLAAAVRSQLAFRRLVQMADLRRLTAATDELTGLANRRALYAEGAALVEPGRRRHALLVLDLDKFKEVNDSLGHRAGDQLLVQHVYCDADDANDTTRLQTVEELHTALGAGQLVVHYQPKVDLDTGEVHAVEALVRWEHPARGLLYPDAFLYLVEESGLMPTLTRVVLAQALDQVKLWQAQGQQLVVAVNLSASSLVDSDLPRQVASMLAARGVSPHALQLEITEEFLMDDHDRARSILTRLRSSGVQISVDDYGTGYSSLSYLRDLPIDELKLDRSFILPMLDDARAVALVASTIAMAHSLGLRMVAESVETGAAYAELARLGCDQAQGYYMSRPVPAAELDHWLRSWRALDKLTGRLDVAGAVMDRR